MPFPAPPDGMPIDDLDDDDARAVAQQVEADVVQGLSARFEPGEFSLSTAIHRADGALRSVNGRLVAIAWQLKAVPLPDSGLPAERTAWIEGTTFVDTNDSDDPAEWTFARYIDWHSVFVDLGVAGAARIVAQPQSQQ
jgi:hypothetical protein